MSPDQKQQLWTLAWAVVGPNHDPWPLYQAWLRTAKATLP